MLNNLLRRLTEQKPKRRHLNIQISTVYKFNPAANETLSSTSASAAPAPAIKMAKPPTIDDIHRRAAQHPAFKNATLEIRHLDKGTLLVGFDKPKKIDTHVIVYPEQVYRSHKWYDLTERAQRYGIKIGIFQLRSDNKCVEITQNEQSFYLIDRQTLKLRHWSVVPISSI